MTDQRRDIFLRAHTVKATEKTARSGRSKYAVEVDTWPERALIFDTETRTTSGSGINLRDISHLSPDRR